MKPFMHEDFLLSTPAARTLYHDYAKDMPIVDYHCHVSPQEIWENKQFKNITDVWLGGDHYKWRLMRSQGIPEKYITGDASDREKFQKFAEMLPRAIGNPMYHWCHLELKRYFGYNGVLNGNTAQEVWDLAEKKLTGGHFGARDIINMSNVLFVGTTDDPADSLEWHEKIKNDPSMKTKIAPSFRPDKSFNIDKAGWKEYMEKLSQAAGVEIKDLDTLEKALRLRMDRFKEMGCRASDHGFDFMVFVPAERKEVDRVIEKGLRGENVSFEEASMLKTALAVFCAKEYSKMGWAMQIHYNCFRNPNKAMFDKLGPDTGFDCVGPHNGGLALKNLLSYLYERNELPKCILYSLDGKDNAFLDSLIGAFQQEGLPGQMQHGSAWWFNDHIQGMRDQMISLANLSLLGNFVGMLTDSRSFLSYTRHEYFRRILCDLIGGWMEEGLYPDDMEFVGSMVQDICCNNAKRFFGLE